MQTQPICPICKATVVKSAKKVKNIASAPERDPKAAKNSANAEESPFLRQKNLKSGTISAQNSQKIQKIQTCQKSIANITCPNCEMPFAGLWSFGWREGVLEKLVEEYKYQSVRAMGEVLVELYDEILPGELEDLVVVPLPTIGRHIRERGFDHTLTLAKKLARRRRWQCQPILSRAVDTVQVGAKMAERQTQAAKAYAMHGKIDPRQHYLLLDDVWTTGSTMLAAEKTLRAAGAETISAVVLAVSRAKAAPDAS